METNLNEQIDNLRYSKRRLRELELELEAFQELQIIRDLDAERVLNKFINEITEKQ